MKAVKSGKAIVSNVKSNELALANSIKIDLPTKILKETTSGLLKVTPTFNKAGKLNNNLIDIKPNKGIIKPVIVDEGYYLDSDSQTRYRFAKESNEELKKYGVGKKLPAMKKTGSGSMVKAPVAVGEITYSEIPNLTKPQLISKLKELAPSLKNLAPKKKAELVTLLQDFMKPKPLDIYKPADIPPFRGAATDISYDPSLLDFTSERSLDPDTLASSARIKRLAKSRRKAGLFKASMRDKGLKLTRRPPVVRGV